MDVQNQHMIQIVGDSQVEKILSDFQFTEGPVWIPDGFLLFSDIPADTITIFLFVIHAALAVFAAKHGRAQVAGAATVPLILGRPAPRRLFAVAG